MRRSRERPARFRTFGCIKLETNFENRNLVAQLIDQAERFLLCRHVERDDDLVGCHSELSRGIPWNYPVSWQGGMSRLRST